MQQNKQHGAALVRNVRSASGLRFRNVTLLSAALAGSLTAIGQITLPKVHIPTLKPLSSLTIRLIRPAWAESATGEIPKPAQKKTDEITALRSQRVDPIELNGVTYYAPTLESGELADGRRMDIMVILGLHGIVIKTYNFKEGVLIAEEIDEQGLTLSNDLKNPAVIFAEPPQYDSAGCPKWKEWIEKGGPDWVVVGDFAQKKAEVRTRGADRKLKTLPPIEVQRSEGTAYSGDDIKDVIVQRTKDGKLVITFEPTSPELSPSFYIDDRPGQPTKWTQLPKGSKPLFAMVGQ